MYVPCNPAIPKDPIGLSVISEPNDTSMDFHRIMIYNPLRMRTPEMVRTVSHRTVYRGIHQESSFCVIWELVRHTNSWAPLDQVTRNFGGVECKTNKCLQLSGVLKMENGISPYSDRNERIITLTNCMNEAPKHRLWLWQNPPRDPGRRLRGLDVSTWDDSHSDCQLQLLIEGSEWGVVDRGGESWEMHRLLS